MILDRVTLTGADDNTNPGDLLELSAEYPHVEWGILFGSHGKSPRYPSMDWMWKLHDWIESKSATLHPKFSAHLCGVWVRSFVLEANFSWKTMYGFVAPFFQRVQLNFHGQYHEMQVGHMIGRMAENADKEFIFQHDGVNNEQIERIVTVAKRRQARATVLFDVSGGAGVLPESWPAPIGDYCGYAGGLGPENVVEQVEKIAAVVPKKQRIWIDMETRVRSDDDQVFDLAKCRAVLEAVRKYVKE